MQAHFKLSSPKFGSSVYFSSVLSHFVTTSVITPVILRLFCRCFIRLLVIVDFQLSSLPQYNNAEIIIASDSFISCWRIYASFSRCPKHVGAFYICAFCSSSSIPLQFVIALKYIGCQIGFTADHWTGLSWLFQVVKMLLEQILVSSLVLSCQQWRSILKTPTWKQFYFLWEYMRTANMEVVFSTLLTGCPSKLFYLEVLLAFLMFYKLLCISLCTEPEGITPPSCLIPA